MGPAGDHDGTVFGSVTRGNAVRRPIVNFRFDTVGGRMFGQATLNNVGQRLAIVLDNKVISAPVINSPIVGGIGIIEGGGFTIESVQDLSLLLRAGALPAPLNILEERTVGPSLGADSILAGKFASILGVILVGLMMNTVNGAQAGRKIIITDIVILFLI